MHPAKLEPARVVSDDRAMEQLVAELGGEPVLACDLESNGMFAYRARLCVVQLATPRGVFVLDTLAASPGPLGRLLSQAGPLKIIHDVAFDARILAENGIELGNVHDTSIAARMLGHTSTGLASLLASELGLTVDKAMQQHDWSERPLDERMLAYLSADVRHLAELEEKIWTEIRAKGIEREVDEETRYRLGTAIASAREVDERPPYVRVKGCEKLPPVDLAVLRHLCAAREEAASRLDVPPYKVVGNETLLAIAAARPTSLSELGKIRGARQGRAAPLGNRILEAVRAGVRDGQIPEADRAWFERPRMAPAIARARKERESRLLAWRRAEAKRREVDEQVVLPGHCAKDIVALEQPSLDAIAAVPGIGGFRVERDGEAILRALTGAGGGA
jgi:ribonuclease D